MKTVARGRFAIAMKHAPTALHRCTGVIRVTDPTWIATTTALVASRGGAEAARIMEWTRPEPGAI